MYDTKKEKLNFIGTYIHMHIYTTNQERV